MESILIDWKILFVVPRNRSSKIPTYSLVRLRKTSLTVVLMQHGRNQQTARIANVVPFVKHLDQGYETVLTDDEHSDNDNWSRHCRYRRNRQSWFWIEATSSIELTDQRRWCKKGWTAWWKVGLSLLSPTVYRRLSIPMRYSNGPRTHHRAVIMCFPWWRTWNPLRLYTGGQLIKRKKLEHWLQAFWLMDNDFLET